MKMESRVIQESIKQIKGVGLVAWKIVMVILSAQKDIIFKLSIFPSEFILRFTFALQKCKNFRFKVFCSELILHMFSQKEALLAEMLLWQILRKNL